MIHREGYPIIGSFFAFFILVNFFCLTLTGWPDPYSLAVLCFSFVIFFLIVRFFRNPKRTLTVHDEYITAPADGRIVAIEETEENEIIKSRMVQISIFMSPLDVHLNRYPVSGQITYYRYHPGKYLLAFLPKSSLENERTTLIITNRQNDILVRQIAGGLARRIVTYGLEGSHVRQGDEMGFIKFGSRVDILFRPGHKVLVKHGEKVRGGVTKLVHLTA